MRDFPSLSFQDFTTAVKQFASGKLDPAWGIVLQSIPGSHLPEEYKKGQRQINFPLGYRLSSSLKQSIRGIIQIAYAILPDQAIPADMSSGRYIMRDESMLIKEVSRYWISSREIIDSRISNYQALIHANPEINFYVFLIERLPYTSNHPLSQYFWNADNGQALAYFESQKPEELVLAKMTLSSFADR